MKKIAIITELSLESINYGNNIQAYALNRYLNKKYVDCDVETLLLKKGDGREITSIQSLLKRVIKKIQVLATKTPNISLDNRKEKFNDFVNENMKLSHENYTYEELKESTYDYYIVGSDIVWFQSPGFINKNKFLTFSPKVKGAKKIAYAASFGENYIPKENKKKLHKYISDFDYVSVRENRSIGLIEGLGVKKKVVHVCDPTLLLSRDEWDSISPDTPDLLKYEGVKYALIYIIGTEKYEDEIKRLCDIEKVIPVYLTCDFDCTNEYVKSNSFFNCSPEEWIWMIKNAEFVLTDSFHGLIFSTIFEKKFLIVRRENMRNLNLRLIDFLEKIEETDKLVDLSAVSSLNEYNWDYKKVNGIVEKFIDESNDYLMKCLE